VQRSAQRPPDGDALDLVGETHRAHAATGRADAPVDDPAKGEDTVPRLLAAVLLAAGLVTGAAGPVSADAGVSKQVTGSVSGTQSFTVGANGCWFVYEEFHLTVAGARPGKLEVSGCVNQLSPFPNERYTYEGNFVYVAHNGAALTGSVSGPLLTDTVRLDLVLTVESGTKQLRNVVGAMFRLTSLDFSPQLTNLTGTLEAV
jgi:hypothetical protein